MPDFRSRIQARLAPLGLRPEREAEIVEELAQHLDDRYRDRLSRGADESAALAAAWVELEQADVLVREVARVERRQPLELPPPGAPARGRWLAALWQDLRASVRAFRTQRVFTLTVVGALALSIGPTTAIASLGNWLFWRPAPGVVDPDRLGIAWFGQWQKGGVSPAGVSYPNIADLRARLTTSTGLAGVQEQSETVAAGDEVARRAGVAFVTANFFDVLGLQPDGGRWFAAADDLPPAGAPVVIVSRGLARRSFGSVQTAIGQHILIDRRSFEIIGVAPTGFTGITPTSTIDAWITGATVPYLWGQPNRARADSREDGLFAMFVARLAPHADFARLQTELDVRSAALAAEYPQDNRKFSVVTARVFPHLGPYPIYRERMRTMLNVMFAIGAVLLALGCANVANLLIARALRGQHDLAVRRSLGASPWRLIQRQLVESWVLALAGAALGLVVAVVLKQVVQQLLFSSPDGTVAGAPIDLTVLAVTSAIAVAIGTIAGSAPAWVVAHGRSAGLSGASGSRSVTRAPRLRTGLAAVQLALSVTLLVGALLLVTTLRNLRAVDLGFNLDGLSAFSMSFSGQGYDAPRALQFNRDLLTSLAGLPPPSAVAFANRAPFDSRSTVNIVPPGSGPDAADKLEVDSNGISANYFDVLGTPLVRGRAFTADETFATAPRETMPVIINESLATRLFGESDPIGRTVRMVATRSTARDLPVVGVVRDSRWTGFTGAPGMFLFEPIGRSSFGAFQATLIVRSTMTTTQLGAAVRSVAARLDRSLPLSDGQPLASRIDRDLRQQRLFAVLLTWLSVLAFSLAALGLYGLVSQMTSERAREFGIRLAIGATRTDIVKLVGRYVVVVTAIGGCVGLGLAVAGARAVSAMLFGVTGLDLRVYGLASATLMTVVALATAWPAVRATRVQPVDVLRVD